jgi:hypothetical protein
MGISTTARQCAGMGGDDEHPACLDERSSRGNLVAAAQQGSELPLRRHMDELRGGARPLPLPAYHAKQCSPSRRGGDLFFDNLVPDSDAIRARLRRRFGTQDESAFALLEAIGRDCVGAIQLLPDGQSSRGYKRIDATALDDNEVERVICIPVRPESPRPNR